MFHCRFLQVRYEDLGVNTAQVTKDIFKFLDLTYTASVAKFVKDHTSLATTGIHKKRVSTYNTFRDSRATVFAWRKALSFPQVQRIQSVCEGPLSKLEYRIFKDPAQYNNSDVTVLVNDPVN